MRISWRLAGLVLALGGLLACHDEELLPRSDGGSGGAEADAVGGDAAEQADADALDAGSDAEDAPTFDLEVPPGCNPIAFEHDCLLPYPTDFFRAPDPTTATGSRVALTPEAQLVTSGGGVMDPLAAVPPDGFSRYPVILAYFGADLDASALARYGDPDGVAGTPAQTLLLDTVDGAPVPHFAEVDERPNAGGRRALFIRPYAPLAAERRYVVALRGLTFEGGAPVAAPSGFEALRSGVAAGHPVLGPLQERYDAEVFPEIEAAGWERESLVLAWDFTTGSDLGPKADLLAMRAKAMDHFEAAPPTPTLELVEEGPDFTGKLPSDFADRVARRVHGTLEVPLFLEAPGPVSRIHRGADGLPEANGTTAVPFVLLITQGAMDRIAAGEAPRLLQFGHGFFGGTGEVEDSQVFRTADALGLVVAATSWWGMTSEDVGYVAQDIIGEPSELLRFTDRVHQAMVNQMALSEALMGPLRAAPELQVDGAPAWSEAPPAFYGLSQGHILGGTFAALSPHIERAVLGVGGAGFTFIMSRARPFDSFLDLIGFQLADPLDAQKLIALLPTTLDRIDPLTWAEHFATSPLDGAPATRRVLLQLGIGDTQVPTYAGHLHARALGVPLALDAPRDVPLLPSVAPGEGGLDTSGLIETDYGIDPEPTEANAIPKVETCVHEDLRTRESTEAQIDLFLGPAGVLGTTCDGPCQASCP
jgi:hypothetical protein